MIHDETCWKYHQGCAILRIDTLTKERDEARKWAQHMYGCLQFAGIVCEKCGQVMVWHGLLGFLCPHCEPGTCPTCGAELVNGRCPITHMKPGDTPCHFG